MSQYIAFLRAINVGGGRSVKMKVLHQCFEALDFSSIKTFIASGNVTFETTSGNAKSLEKKIEKRLREELEYEVEVFIRTDRELAKIANHKSFPQSKISSAAEFNILLLRAKLDAKSKTNIMELQTDTNEFHVHGREIYWLRSKLQGKSTFSTVPFEKILGKEFTIRSAKTIKKIVLKLSGTKHG